MDTTDLATIPARASRSASWLAILFFTTTLLASCGGGGGYSGSNTGQNLAPSISTQPANLTVTAGMPANFSVTVAGYMPMTFQWQRDGVDIMGATQTSYTLAAATLADNGATFRVKVSNVYGNAESTSATLTVN